MMVFRRKQIVVLALVLMIVIAGYLQYSYKKNSNSDVTEQDKKPGEAVYVDSSEFTIEDKESILEFTSGEDVSASAKTEDYFAQAKLDREITRSRDTDAYRDIIDNPNATDKMKSEAYDSMMALIKNTDREMRIETLIKERGYDDVIALLGEDGSIDVIVKTSSLTDAKVAQIADVVTRQANVEMSQVHIKNMY